MKLSWKQIALLIPLSLTDSSRAEQRVYDEISFSASVCQDLGYSADFDECAVMEFCSSPPDRHFDRALRQVSHDEVRNSSEEQSIDETFASEVEEAEEEQHNAKKDDDSWEEVEDDHGLVIENENEEPIGTEGTSQATGAPNEAINGWRIPGSSTCSWPGPILRMRRGVNHGLFIKGSSGTPPTNLHFHGLHISGHGNGDDLYRSVEGDDNVMIYGIILPADQHMGGTHWYHSHLTGASWEQVLNGAFGMIVVDDNNHDVGSNDEDVLMFLANEVILIFDNSKGDWKANGLRKEILKFVSGEWYRLRILLVDLNSHEDQVDIHFDSGCEVRPIAHDGIFRFEVPGPQMVASSLTSASRLDVAIKCSVNANIRLGGLPIVQVQVDSSTQPSLATPFEAGVNSWSSRRMEYTKDLLSLDPAHWLTVSVGETEINDISSYQNEPLCDSEGNDFQYGSVLGLELRGAETHPFHMHMYPMQVASEGCGSGHVVGEFYDTIVTANRDEATPCYLRVHLVDVSGPTVVHCHIFEHAEQGALGWFNVEGGPIQDGPTCMAGSRCGERIQPLPKCKGQRRLRR